MLHATSISLGSKSGDFERTMTLAGFDVHLTREGTDGDMERAAARIRSLDGTVDAIGLGGIDIYLYVDGEPFIIGDGKRLAENAHVTPVVDGSGLKHTLERSVVRKLASSGRVGPQTRVLVVSALDRFGMAEAFVQAGCACVFGDLIFNIGLDYPLNALADIHDLAKKYRKRMLTVPFHMLYPTGPAQEASAAEPKYAKYYEAADVIAGDAHLILKHLPKRVDGKGIVTNTTRPHTIQRFKEAGAAWVVTTTPDIDGISGGTNLMEAALVALIGECPEQAAAQYNTWLDRLGWSGQFSEL